MARAREERADGEEEEGREREKRTDTEKKVVFQIEHVPMGPHSSVVSGRGRGGGEQAGLGRGEDKEGPRVDAGRGRGSQMGHLDVSDSQVI